VVKKTRDILNNLKEKNFGKNYPGKYEILENPDIRLVHDLDFLYLIRNDVINSLKFDLKGLRVAIHYGCHYLNLERDKKANDGQFKESLFRDKTKLEELVELFGGTPVDYQEREACEDHSTYLKRCLCCL